MENRRDEFHTGMPSRANSCRTEDRLYRNRCSLGSSIWGNLWPVARSRDRSILRITGGLHEEQAGWLEQRQAFFQRRQGAGQVFEHIHHHDGIEGAGGDRLIFDRALEHGDVEGFPGEIDDPGAELQSGGVIPGLAEQRDKAARTAADLQDFRRRQEYAQQRFQPVQQRSGRSVRARLARSGRPRSVC